MGKSKNARVAGVESVGKRVMGDEVGKVRQGKDFGWEDMEGVEQTSNQHLDRI